MTSRAASAAPPGPAQAPPAGPREPRRGIIVAALMAAMSLAALEVTVVGTALPTIVGTLGGISLYTWVFSAYLLTSTTTSPLYGKLSDTFGRKPVLLFGIGLFALGSLLCGLAGSMEQLVLFRAVQGLGAGAILPVTLTIIGDLFPLPERGKVQGYFSGVWGSASIVGPAVGGLIVDHADWRWIFLLNLPMGGLAALLLWRFLHERVPPRSQRIDYAGATTLTVAILALLLGLTEGGHTLPWDDPRLWLLFAIAALGLALFVRIEVRAADPLLSIELMGHPLIATTNAAGFLWGAVMFGATSFVPLYLQGLLGGTATAAGAALAPLSLGWPVASIIAGRVITRTGYRLLGLIGGGLVAAGASILFLAVQGGGQPLAMIGMAVVGLGLGSGVSAYLLGVQSAVAWQQRGVVTSASYFFRAIGGSVGVALLGVLFNLRMLPALAAGGPLADANALLDPHARSAIPAEALAALRQALELALHDVFLAVLGAGILAFVATLIVPPGPERSATEGYSKDGQMRRSGKRGADPSR